MLEGVFGDGMASPGLEGFLAWTSLIVLLIEGGPDLFFWLLRKFGTPTWG